MMSGRAANHFVGGDDAVLRRFLRRQLGENIDAAGDAINSDTQAMPEIIGSSHSSK